MFYFVTLILFFFFKQKTAYEMRISDWSSDVCSSDLTGRTFWSASLPPSSPSRAVSKSCATRAPKPRKAKGGRHERHARTRYSSIVAGPSSRGRRLPGPRPVERRVGKECVSPSRSRLPTYHSK